jgi:thiol-disulfide isomerase/thioredoxin
MYTILTKIYNRTINFMLLKNKNSQILRGGTLAFIALNFFSCVVMDNKYTSLAPGIWRGVLQLAPPELVVEQNNEIHSARQLLEGGGYKVPENKKMAEANEGELPFLFEVAYINDTIFKMDIINGEERIAVPAEDIRFGRSRETGKDTILINFPVFGSYIRAVFQERVMEGDWVYPAKNQTIPFVARFGQNKRFTSLSKTPKADLTGKWECTFDLASKAPYKAVGELKQTGNVLRGTFRTETGDYRFLDGEVQADKFYLSCFDGSHAFVFEGKIRDNGHLDAFFRSSKNKPEIWEAKKNETFELRNANSLTKLKREGESIDFTFPDATGKAISINNYAGKVKIVQIMGTWCPNCRDETNFLINYLKRKPSEKLAVVALAFERNAENAATQVATYKQKMAVPYDVLVAGTTTDKDEAAKSLKWLDKVVAYPTLLFIDKNNKVRRIHTGFDGPATSKHAEFTAEFENYVEKMLRE